MQHGKVRRLMALLAAGMLLGTGALAETEYAQCEVCGGIYEVGNVFRNHICVPIPAPDTVAIGVLYVNAQAGDSLAMRAAPQADAAVVTTLENGTQVTLFSYVDSSWAYVAYRSYFGYCPLSDLSQTIDGEGGSTPAESEDPYKDFKAVNDMAEVQPTSPTGFVNLRWAPSLEASVQTIYYAGEKLRVLATDGIWSQVYNETTHVCGFMMNIYLQ